MCSYFEQYRESIFSTDERRQFCRVCSVKVAAKKKNSYDTTCE